MKKYYVVWEGKTPGVYDSWELCRKQVEGFTSAKYKSFPTREDALEALHNNPLQYLKKQGSQKHRPDGNQGAGKPINKSISVDAACSGNPGILEYRGVHTATGQEIFHRGPFPEGTTNIGEFLAIVTGLVWLRQNNLNIPLYSDSYNGILWVKQRKVNTRLERTPKNEELFLIVEKALDWLQNNPYENQVLKWQTSSWGEIPADFGRK